MNGATAQSLREKGINYHLNWGVSLQHLQEMAAEIREDLATDQFLTLHSSLYPLFFGKKTSASVRYLPPC